MPFPFSARSVKIVEMLKHSGIPEETRIESSDEISSHRNTSAGMEVETRMESSDVISFHQNTSAGMEVETTMESSDEISSHQNTSAGMEVETNSKHIEIEMIQVEYADISCDQTTEQQNTGLEYSEYDLACAGEFLEVIYTEANSEPNLQEMTAGISADAAVESIFETNFQEVTTGTSIDEEMGAETSAEKSQKKRRHADPAMWQKNIRKNNRCTGKAYTSVKGVQVPAKKPNLCCNCKLQCFNFFSQEEIDTLHGQYYQLGNAQLQKSMLCNLIEEKNVERNRFRGEVPLKPKSCSRFYYLPKDDKKLRVCVNFFIHTFCISYSVIRLAMNNKMNLTYVGSDGRKGRPAPNATPAAAVEAIKAHIDSFPRVESHYCRKESNRLYLSADLNLSMMYRFYRDEYCPKNATTPVSEAIYRKIFNEYDPPLTFYIPKKDQCSVCNLYNREKDKTALEEEYRHHKRREAESMQMKNEDKIRSVQDKGKTYRSISFDMQAILSIPHSGDSQIYYKRKLSMYNFTIFDNYNADGLCYIWDETQGGKGSSEVGTCLLKYLSGLPKEVLHVSCFSDTCGGQNRNQHVATAMLFAVNNYTCHTIDLKFMESGHSYLEADSIHSTIERKKKHSNVYSLNEWKLLIELSRIKPRPYKVSVLKHKDMFDLQEVSKLMLKNIKIDTQEETVNWLKIKWLRFQKKNPNSILFKYNLSDDEFREIDVMKKNRRSGRNRSWNLTLPYKYLNPLPISRQKMLDLKYLLDRGIIPSEYKDYIEGLPSLTS